MKNMIAKCVEIKKQYDILNANKDHVESQYLVIFQLQEKLKSVQQENAKLEQETRKAISVAQNAIDELKLARAKK
jgi:hypothetical protein